MRIRILLVSTATSLFCCNAFAQLTKSGVSAVSTGKLSQYNWYFTSRSKILSSFNNAAGSTVMDSKSLTTTQGKVEMGVGLLPATNSEKINSSTTVMQGELSCSKRNISLNYLVNQDFAILNQASASAKIFPGAFFKANSIINQSFAFYQTSYARKPIMASIYLPSYKPNGLREILLDEPGSFQQTKFDSLARTNYGVALPSMIGVSSDEFSSKLELAAKLGASAGLLLPLQEFDIPLDLTAVRADSHEASASASLKFYMFKLIQPMYTISIKNPNPADKFVDPLAYRNCSDGVMVHSVTYGRMVFIMVSSFESAIKVKSALQAKLGVTFTTDGASIGAEGSGEVTGSADFSTVINTFKAVIIGGNASSGNKLAASVDELKNYITSSSASTLTQSTSALPISYTLVRISDNSNVGVRSTATYDLIEDCVPLTGFAIYVNSFSVSKVVDNPVTGNDEDLYGKVTVRAYYKKPDGTISEIKDESGRSQEVFSTGAGNVVKLKQGESKVLWNGNSIMDGKRKFMFTPDQIRTGYIEVKFDLKDKILQDGEQLLNGNSFVQYDATPFRYPLIDWINGVTKSELKEVGSGAGDAKLTIQFTRKRE